MPWKRYCHFLPKLLGRLKSEQCCFSLILIYFDFILITKNSVQYTIFYFFDSNVNQRTLWLWQILTNVRFILCHLHARLAIIHCWRYCVFLDKAKRLKMYWESWQVYIKHFKETNRFQKPSKIWLRYFFPFSKYWPFIAIWKRSQTTVCLSTPDYFSVFCLLARLSKLNYSEWDSTRNKISVIITCTHQPK